MIYSSSMITPIIPRKFAPQSVLPRRRKAHRGCFQPQRYTRTYFLLDQFSRAFSEADEVIITDIYSTSWREAD